METIFGVTMLVPFWVQKSFHEEMLATTIEPPLPSFSFILATHVLIGIPELIAMTQPTFWYYQVDGKRQGPIRPSELRNLAKIGQISPETPVLREGLSAWVTASRVRGLFATVSLSSAGSSETLADASLANARQTDALSANVYLSRWLLFFAAAVFSFALITTTGWSWLSGAGSTPIASADPSPRATENIDVANGLNDDAKGLAGAPPEIIASNREQKVWLDPQERKLQQPIANLKSGREQANSETAKREMTVTEQEPNIVLAKRVVTTEEAKPDELDWNQYTPSGVSAQSLAATSQRLVKEGRILLSGNLRCLLFDESGSSKDAFRGDDATALLEVAKQKRISVFVHGFQPDQWGGRPSQKAVQAMWQPHIDSIKRQHQPFVACLFRFDTRAGFGDHQPELANFLFGLRWLTDDPKLYSPDRKLTIISHSNGGNFVKHGVVLQQKYLAASRVPPRGRANTPTRIIFLATPHYGTDLTNFASAGSALYTSFTQFVNQAKNKNYGDYALDRARTKTAAQFELIAKSHGAKQLKSFNDQLVPLNVAFLRAVRSAGNYEYLSLGSPNDLVVPLESSNLNGSDQWVVDGLGHSDFLAPRYPNSYSKLLFSLYQPRPESSLREILRRPIQKEIANKPNTYGNTPRFAETVVARPVFSESIARYLISRLRTPVNDEIIEKNADILARKIQASSFPEHQVNSWKVASPKGMMLPLYKLSDLTTLGRTSLDRERANQLVEELQGLLDPLLMQVIPDLWSESRVRCSMSEEELRRIAKRLEKNRYLGPGALTSMREFPLASALNRLYSRSGIPLRQSITYDRMLPEEIRKLRVLKCTFRRHEYKSQMERFYWLNNYLEDFKQLLEKVPTNHPIRKIYPPVDEAPNRIEIE